MAPTPGASQEGQVGPPAGEGRAGASHQDPEADSFRDHLEKARRLVALELDLAETRRRLAEDNLKITEAQLELAEREIEALKAENERLCREIQALRDG
jgi:chromosome segregation ATPase